ncbi:hypothetical protein ACHAXM_010620 [Skeletonema potamos]
MNFNINVLDNKGIVLFLWGISIQTSSLRCLSIDQLLFSCVSEKRLDEAQALLQRNSVLDESRKSFSKGLPKHFNSDEGEQVMATPTV